LPGPLRGALWSLLAAACFAAMGGCVRALAATGMHPLETSLFRSIFGLALLLPFMARIGFGLIRTERHGLFMLRGVASAISQAFYFVAIAFLPMADAISLTFAGPLFGTILAVIVLGEVLRARRWAAMLAGFAGVLIILRPGFADVSLLTLTPLCAAVALGFVWIFVKMLSATEPTERVVFYMMVYTLPLNLVPALLVWTAPTPDQYLWFLATAAVANLGQFAMTNAYRAAEATAVFPYDFARLPFTAVIAWFAFAEAPDGWTWAGAAVIFGSTFYIMRREARQARLAREENKAREDAC
jgi:drug/metabolite transporter (DMT)-like permease